jgi:hypothetical protein
MRITAPTMIPLETLPCMRRSLLFVTKFPKRRLEFFTVAYSRIHVDFIPGTTIKNFKNFDCTGPFATNQNPTIGIGVWLAGARATGLFLPTARTV